MATAGYFHDGRKPTNEENTANEQPNNNQRPSPLLATARNELNPANHGHSDNEHYAD